MFGFETKRELRDRLQQVERRESSYTASIVALLSNSASGRLYTALPTATAALEACSGLVGRAFSAAVVKTENDTVLGVLNPACLSLIGRTLIRQGELVLYISVDDMGELRLLPCSSWAGRGQMAIPLQPGRTIEDEDLPAD